MIAFYATQLHLLSRWNGGRLGVARRGAVTLVIGVVALVIAAWLVPGFGLRDAPSAIAATLALGALRTLLRPVLIAYVSELSIAVATLVTVLVQALAFWIISIAGWIVLDRPVDAVIASVVLSIGNAVLTAVLSTGDDNSFFGTLVRQLAARHRRSGLLGDPGVVFVQIDGLAASVIGAELRAGHAPTLARWLRSGAMTLDRWEALLPTQTSATQAGVLHGNNDGIPAFRWWDKETGRLIVSNHPKDAREIERRVSNGDGLLARTGASIGNLLSGDAPRSFLTAATVDAPAKELRRSHVLDWFFISPYSYVRWTLLSIGEVLKELFQARVAARNRRRGPRGFPYPLARAATNVLLRHLTTALVIEEMWRRTSPIYVDYVDYDEIAHHAGPRSIEARDAISGLDKILGILERAAADAPRRYRFVVLSDHGQSPGAMFSERHRKSLAAVVQDLVGERVVVQGATAHVEHWGRLSPLLSAASGISGMTRRLTSAAFRRRAGAVDDADRSPDVVVAASGNLAHISFPAIAGRAVRDEIEAAYPGLIDGLASHAGIGLVMVRIAGRGPVAFGPAGNVDLVARRVAGTDPLAAFEASAPAGLVRLDAMAACGDLVVVSAFDPESGEVAPFEEQIGSHGGLGGEQNDAFVLHPAEWPAEAPLVGAVGLHTQIRHWLRSAR